jgi:hypothetical protein
MKKILVLTTMVLLVCSMSVVAQDNITISGETLYEFYHDLDSEYGWNGDAEIMVQAVVDDYNTANVKIEYVQGGVSYDAAALGGPVISIIDEGGPSYMELNRGYFTTALGKYVGLEDMGVTITVDWGYNEFDDPSYGQITAYAIEDIWEAKKRDVGRRNRCRHNGHGPHRDLERSGAWGQSECLRCLCGHQPGYGLGVL